MHLPHQSLVRLSELYSPGTLPLLCVFAKTQYSLKIGGVRGAEDDGARLVSAKARCCQFPPRGVACEEQILRGKAETSVWMCVGRGLVRSSGDEGEGKGKGLGAERVGVRGGLYWGVSARCALLGGGVQCVSVRETSAAVESREEGWGTVPVCSTVVKNDRKVADGAGLELDKGVPCLVTDYRPRDSIEGRRWEGWRS